MEPTSENVIYIQVDDSGQILNYSTNISGEQILLFQEGAEQPVFVQQSSQPLLLASGAPEIQLPTTTYAVAPAPQMTLSSSAAPTPRPPGMSLLRARQPAPGKSPPVIRLNTANQQKPNPVIARIRNLRPPPPRSTPKQAQRPIRHGVVQSMAPGSSFMLNPSEVQVSIVPGNSPNVTSIAPSAPFITSIEPLPVSTSGYPNTESANLTEEAAFQMSNLGDAQTFFMGDPNNMSLMQPLDSMFTSMSHGSDGMNIFMQDDSTANKLDPATSFSATQMQLEQQQYFLPADQNLPAGFLVQEGTAAMSEAQLLRYSEGTASSIDGGLLTGSTIQDVMDSHMQIMQPPQEAMLFQEASAGDPSVGTFLETEPSEPQYAVEPHHVVASPSNQVTMQAPDKHSHEEKMGQLPHSAEEERSGLNLMQRSPVASREHQKSVSPQKKVIPGEQKAEEQEDDIMRVTISQAMRVDGPFTDSMTLRYLKKKQKRQSFEGRTVGKDTVHAETPLPAAAIPAKVPETVQNPEPIPETISAEKEELQTADESVKTDPPLDVTHEEPMEVQSIESQESKELDLTPPKPVKHLSPKITERSAVENFSEKSDHDTSNEEKLPTAKTPEANSPKKRTFAADDSIASPKSHKAAGEKDSPDDPGKKSFMANFDLIPPTDISHNRRSKRISFSESTRKKKDDDTEEHSKSEKSSEEAEVETHTQHEEVSSGVGESPKDQARSNIFDMFHGISSPKLVSSKMYKPQGEKLGPDGDVRQREIDRLRKELGEANKKLAKAHDLKEHNGESSSVFSPSRKVGTIYKHGKFSFSSSSREHTPHVTKVTSPKEDTKKMAELEAWEEALIRRENKLRALDQELDMRTSSLKVKEGQVQRQSTEIKSQKTKLAYEWKEVERRVKDIEYRERMLEGKTKDALKKWKPSDAPEVSEDDKTRDSFMRGLQLDQKERDLKNRKAELDRKEEELIEAVKVEDESEALVTRTSPEKSFTKAKIKTPKTKAALPDDVEKDEIEKDTPSSRTSSRASLGRSSTKSSQKKSTTKSSLKRSSIKSKLKVSRTKAGETEDMPKDDSEKETPSRSSSRASLGKSTTKSSLKRSLIKSKLKVSQTKASETEDMPKDESEKETPSRSSSRASLGKSSTKSKGKTDEAKVENQVETKVEGSDDLGIPVDLAGQRVIGTIHMSPQNPPSEVTATPGRKRKASQRPTPKSSGKKKRKV